MPVPAKYSELPAILYIFRPQVQMRLGTFGAVPSHGSLERRTASRHYPPTAAAREPRPPPVERRGATLPQFLEPGRLHPRQSVGDLEESSEEEIRLDPDHARDRHEPTQVGQDVDAFPCSRV